MYLTQEVKAEIFKKHGRRSKNDWNLREGQEIMANM